MGKAKRDLALRCESSHAYKPPLMPCCFAHPDLSRKCDRHMFATHPLNLAKRSDAELMQ
jgi:hypothetical protein